MDELSNTLYCSTLFRMYFRLLLFCELYHILCYFPEETVACHILISCNMKAEATLSLPAQFSQMCKLLILKCWGQIIFSHHLINVSAKKKSI